MFIAKPEEPVAQERNILTLSLAELREARKSATQKLDHMHSVHDMLVKLRSQACELDISLDIASCIKQLEHFAADEDEIKEGFQLVYSEFESLLMD